MMVSPPLPRPHVAMQTRVELLWWENVNCARKNGVCVEELGKTDECDMDKFGSGLTGE